MSLRRKGVERTGQPTDNMPVTPALLEPSRRLRSVMFCALTISFWLRFDTRWTRMSSFSTHFILRNYTSHIIFGTLSLVFVLANCGVYKRQNLLRHKRHRACDRRRLAASGSSLSWARPDLSFRAVHLPPLRRALGRHLHAPCFPGAPIFHTAGCKDERVAKHLRQRILIVGWSEEAERLFWRPSGTTNGSRSRSSAARFPTCATRGRAA